MSQLKFKAKNLLVKLSPGLKKLKCREARKRYYDLESVCFSRHPVKYACIEIGISEDYFRKWAKRLLEVSNLEGLLSHSRAPLKSPKKTRSNHVRIIKTVREAQPYMGPERIRQRLLEVYPNRKIPCVSTVARVLKREGLVSKKYSQRQTKKHLKRYRRPVCGYLQMDFKYVPYKIDNQQYYQLSVVDHHSDWRLIRIYDNKGFDALIPFLKDLEEECPFPIMQIQTDNDMCFTDKFWIAKRLDEPSGRHPLDFWCRQRKIEHRLIPIDVKELNGKVENTHKQDDREFFAPPYFESLKGIQKAAIENEKRWNERRKTKARKWKTPNEMIRAYYLKTLSLLIYMGLLNKKGTLQITENGTLFYEVPKKKSKIVKITKNRTRKKSRIDRYIKYCEGMDKLKKSFFLNPPMSWSSSLTDLLLKPT